MALIGIVANSKNFEVLKHELCKPQRNGSYQFIHICQESLDNIRNVVFDVVVITCPINQLLEKKQIIEKVCASAKYLVVNADVEIDLEFLKENKIIVISYGLNQKSTVTISSIDEDGALIALQRSMRTLSGEMIEIGEKRISLEENNKLSPQDLLVILIISLICKGE